MQQSFNTQVVQSNLTDCATKPNNPRGGSSDKLTLLTSDESAPLQNIVVVTDAVDAGVCRWLGLRCDLLALLIYAPLIVLLLVLFIWAFIAPSAWLHFVLDMSSSFDATLYSTHTDTYNLSTLQWVSKLWSEKSHAMAILVVLWSLVFPILKLLFILLLVMCYAFKDQLLCTRLTPTWFAPRNSSSTKHASTIFLVLDLLNKYSFLNVFIVLVLMSCLYVHIDHDLSAPFSTHYVDTVVHVHSLLLIQPDRGIVLLTVAMFLTSLLSVAIRYHYLPMYPASSSSDMHALEAMHQKLSMSDQNLTTHGSDDVHPSRTHSSRRRRYSEPLSPLLFSKNYSFRSFCLKMVSFMFFALMVVGAVAVIIGGIALIEVDYVGGESALMSDDLAGRHRLYSINELVQSVDQTNNTGATKLLRIMYQLFGIIMPLITMILLMLLWFIPMPFWLHRRMKQLIWNTHLLNAMDVIVIACVIVQQRLPVMFASAMRQHTPTYCKSWLEYVSDASSICGGLELHIFLRAGFWITIAFYVSLWIVVVYSVYFSVDSYSAKQLRKVKMKIKMKNLERQDRERGQDDGGTLFHTIHENKTL